MTAQEFSTHNCVDKLLQVYKKTQSKAEKNKHSSETEWSELLNRIKTEWTMLANIGNAATSVVAGAVGIDSKIKTDLTLKK